MSEDAYLIQLQQRSLPELRVAREHLQVEERGVSYWRRLVQGRLDLVRAGLGGQQPDAVKATRQSAARESNGGGTRRPLTATNLAATSTGVPSPLVGMEALWDAPIPWHHIGELAEMEQGLVEAEVELSVYRRILHRRLDACTAELVGRYRRDPSQMSSLLQVP